MGWGSSSPPPWMDEEKIEEAHKKQKAEQDAKRIEALEKENEALKKRIKELEDELKRPRK